MSHEVKPGRIELSWSPLSPSYGDSTYNYLVFYNSTEGNFSTVNFTLTSVTSTAFDYLVPNAKFSVQLIAFDLSHPELGGIYSCVSTVKTNNGKYFISVGFCTVT